MKNLYGDAWERYTIVRPPWSTKDVLKCAVKHWMAAVSESFTRRAEPILKELLETITHPPGESHSFNYNIKLILSLHFIYSLLFIMF